MQPIRFIVPVALKEVMEHLTPLYHDEAGVDFDITHMLNPEVPAHIAGGADWDIAITNPQYVETILAAGHAAPDSAAPFARAPLAFAARADGSQALLTRPPDIVARLSAADSIAITKTGTSGQMFRKYAETLGLWADLQPKLALMEGGGPMRALLSGQVALAALPLSNIAPIKETVAIIICDAALNVHIDLSLCVHRAATEQTRRFRDWLLDPALDATLGHLGAQRYHAPR